MKLRESIIKILERLLFRLKSKLNDTWKKIDKDDVLSIKDQLGVEIFKINLYDDNNIKFLSPKRSNKMYIVTKDYIMNNDISTFILFEYSESTYSRLTIVNHEYKYDLDIPHKTSSDLKELFEQKVEDDRNLMEKEIFDNITKSLAILLNKFKEKQKII